MIDKRIESTMNELINAEIWSTNLYLSLQVYFESEQLPILSSWLNTQAQDNMNKVYQMMSWIYHNGGCVAINEIKRDVQKWQAPVSALNELIEHERYMSRLVSILLILCRNVDASSNSFINRLYSDRIYLSTALLELSLNPQLHSRSATYIKRNGLLIRKITIKSSRPFQCAYHPLTP